MSTNSKIDMEQTCAGKPISAAMYRFSTDFVQGCKYLSGKVQAARNDDEVRTLNTACIFFAISAIEAKVNEWISISQQCFIDEPKSFWHSLAPLVKTLPLEKKWNLIASHENGVLWDKSREPFQSFDLIISLRNELIHYKGQFLPKDTPPTKKIKGLMDKFGVKSKSTFVEDDCSSLVYDLLNSRELGSWVASRISDFESKLMKLLLKNT